MAMHHINLLDSARKRTLLDAREKNQLLSDLPRLQVKGLATSYRLIDRDNRPFGVVAVHTDAGVVEGIYEVTPFGVHRASSTGGGR